MMRKPNLLILDGPRYPLRNPNAAYRGTFRSAPRYFEDLPSDHQANTLFLWSIEEGGELGVVHDKQKASQLRDFCNSHCSGSSFELIEVTQKEPVFAGQFLGFDISQGFNNSLLWSGLNRSVPEDPDLPVRVLANTIFGIFSKELNANGLFADVEIARQCRKSLIALQEIEPNLLEGDTLEKFDVISVFVVE